MQEHRDQPDAAGVVEGEELASQRGHEAVGGFAGLPCFQISRKLPGLRHGGFVTDSRFGGGDILDLVVDGGAVEGGVEVGDRGELVVVGAPGLRPGVRRWAAPPGMGRTTCSPAFVQVTGLWRAVDAWIVEAS